MHSAYNVQTMMYHIVMQYRRKFFEMLNFALKSVLRLSCTILIQMCRQLK